MISENDSLALEDFLASLNGESTRKLYQRGISMFSEFSNKSVDEILEERKQDLTQRLTNQSLTLDGELTDLSETSKNSTYHASRKPIREMRTPLVQPTTIAKAPFNSYDTTIWI